MNLGFLVLTFIIGTTIETYFRQIFQFLELSGTEITE